MVQALYGAQGEPTITESGLPAADQRGLSRLFSGTIDIGSFQSQPYVVMNTNDSGAGSLRQAIADDADGTPITFAPSLAGQTITLKTELLIPDSLTIDGTAAPGLIVSGAGVARVIEVAQGATVTLRALTVEHGNANGTGTAANGGGILNSGTLTLDSVTIA